MAGNKMTTAGFKGSMAPIVKTVVPNKPQEEAIAARVISAQRGGSLPPESRALAPLTGMAQKPPSSMSRATEAPIAKGGMGGGSRGPTKRLGS